MKEQLISIIVPVYNGEAYLDRCVQSILAQTYPDWELLLIDGASTDRTPALCDDWQRKDKRIRALHSAENRGVSEGRNRGIRESSGGYLMFVDADDWMLPDCLERLYQDIQIPGVDIAGCAFKSCTDADWEKQQGNMVNVQDNQNNAQINTKSDQTNESPVLISGKNFLREGILKRDTRCWSKLYRKSALEGHFFREDYTIGEDMLFVWEVTKDADLISSSAYQGYCYYYNVNGTMLKPFRETDIDQVRCWQFLLAEIQRENKQSAEHGGTAGHGGTTDYSSTAGHNKAEAHDTDVISETATNLLISCMLVAGKLSGLPSGRRKEYKDIQEKCSRVLHDALQIPGAYERLDKGYRVKVRLYEKAPELYLALYHMWKEKK